MTTRAALLEEGQISPRAMFLHTVREGKKTEAEKESFQGIIRSPHVCGGGRWERLLQAELPVCISNSLF